MNIEVIECSDCGIHIDRRLYAGHACPESAAAQDHDSPPGDEAPSEPSCGGCRFYKRTGDAITSKGSVPGGDGECRRYAPRPGAETWPGVRGTDVCGEFEWREEPEAEPLPTRFETIDGARYKVHGPALPPRECPCVDGKLKPGMKQHLHTCRWYDGEARDR